MADRRDRPPRLVKTAHQVQHQRVEPQVLGSPSPRNDQPAIVVRLDLGECRIEREVVPGLFAVGLIPLKVVNGGPDPVASDLARADHIDPIPQHRQGLIGDHQLVVFDEVARQHQQSWPAHHAVPFAQLLSAICAELSACHQVSPPRPPVPRVSWGGHASVPPLRTGLPKLQGVGPGTQWEARRASHQRSADRLSRRPAMPNNPPSVIATRARVVSWEASG